MSKLPDNKVLYQKTFNKIDNIIEANFIIVNNNKITCPLNVDNNKLLPTLSLKYSDLTFDKYVLGLRNSIPDLTRLLVTPSNIEIDLISEKFDTSLINNGNINNILQYSLTESEEIDQFYKQDNIKYKSVEFISSNKIDHEERLYLNFTKGFLFSIINKNYKLLYVYVDIDHGPIISKLHSMQDIGAINRLNLYWPELDFSVILSRNEIFLQSNKVFKLFNNQYKKSGIFYIFNNASNSEYKYSTPFLTV